MQLKVYGCVQGVGFRPFVYKIATELGYSGYVRNNGSNVEIVLDGDVEPFLEEFKARVPPLAVVERIEQFDETSVSKLMELNGVSAGEFSILSSTEGARESAIPPDTALCSDCLKELFESTDRRFMYPFINCTNCGARFSVISDMPYDRNKTAMSKFKLCDDCNSEFTDPVDRRMHAQTISCPTDGPSFSLYAKGGRQVTSDNPIKDFAAELDSGAIGIVKSWGGMHIVSILSEIQRMRDWYKRPEKPFAVMVKDHQTADKYCIVTDQTRRLLNLPERPIVLMPKRQDTEFDASLELISPGLDTIGLYLPYSAIQYLLFQYLEHDALIMTSANPRGEPLIMTNTEAFELDLDVYLFHNREIINRVDDSLIVPYKDRFYFIRKSRGYVPVPVEVDYNNIILAVGPESNVTSAISKNGKLYTSQYIGNTNYYKTLQFLDSASHYLMRLLGINKLDAIALDLHPQYPSRKLAVERAESLGVKIFEIQHHWAHAASLMLDSGIAEPLVALTLDGAGYGPDKTVWGGEVLYSQFNEYERIGSLELIPLIGGDKAVYEPKRLVFGIFEQLGLNSDDLNYFPMQNAEVFRKILKTSPYSSSLGRVLDSISCYLGIGTKRTYDGEPAMKLERYLTMGATGKSEFEFKTQVTIDESGDHNVVRVQTLPLFKQLIEFVGAKNPQTLPNTDKANLSYSFVTEVLKHLTNLAIDTLKQRSAKYIGLTGGVTYNIPIIDLIEHQVNSAIQSGEIDPAVQFLTHSKFPNGDGGISVGQNIIAGHLLKEEK
jgi:hydrogenase maturation protein HypF